MAIDVSLRSFYVSKSTNTIGNTYVSYGGGGDSFFTQEDASSISTVYNVLSDLDVVAYTDNYVNNNIAPWLKEASLNLSTFKWVSGLLEPSVASGIGDVTKVYVDGSLAKRDSSIASIWIKLGSVDTSLLNLGVKNVYQDSSIVSIWTKIGNVDTSLLNLGVKNAYQDSSLNSIWTTLNLKAPLASPSFTGRLTVGGSGSGNGLIEAIGDESFIGWADRSLYSGNNNHRWGWYATDGSAFLWDNVNSKNRITITNTGTFKSSGDVIAFAT